MCVCLCVSERRGVMCVWMCKHERAYLCASLCVNDISVTMYFGESDPNFVVQSSNSVIPCAVCLFVTPMIFSRFIHVDICVIATDIWKSQLLYSLAKLCCRISCLAYVMFYNFVGY